MITPHKTSRRRLPAYAAGLAGLAAVAQVPGGWTDSTPALSATPFTVDARYVRLEGTRAGGGQYLSAAEVTV